MPIVVSLFSGAGGLDQGFRATGYEIGCCVEMDEWACKTLKKNHPETPVMGPPSHSGDIKSLSATDIYEFAGLRAGDVDVLIGAPPYQGFYPYRTQYSLEKDKQVNLLFEYIRLVTEFQPRAFVLVSSPNLMLAGKGIQLKQALATLDLNGYCTSLPKILNVADYGVLHNREYLIIWGSKTIDNPTLPEATHAGSATLVQRPHSTIVDAFVRMPQNLENHLGLTKSGVIVHLFSFTRPFLERTITAYESAMLQKFDDNYIFEGGIRVQVRQIYNAVSPLFAEHVARHIKLQEYAEETTNSIYPEQYLYHEEDLETLVEKIPEKSKAIQLEAEICFSKDYWYNSLERPIQDFISQYLFAIGVENHREVWDDCREHRADIVANSISTVIEVKRILDSKTIRKAKSQVKTYTEKLNMKYSLVIGLPPLDPKQFQAAKKIAKEQEDWNFKVIFLDPNDSKTLGLDKHFTLETSKNFKPSVRELIRRIQEAVMAYWEAFSRTTKELSKPASKNLPGEATQPDKRRLN